MSLSSTLLENAVDQTTTLPAPPVGTQTNSHELPWPSVMQLLRQLAQRAEEHCKINKGQ